MRRLCGARHIHCFVAASAQTKRAALRGSPFLVHGTFKADRVGYRRQAISHVICFVSLIASRMYVDSSRPAPDFFAPPNGAIWSQ